MDFKIFTVLVLIAGTNAGPVNQNLNSRLLGQTSCARQCTAKSKFGYKDGQIYEFSYEAETKTGVHGASDEQAGLKIVTTAEIEVLSKCELSLQLRNTAVYGSDPNIQSRFIQDSQTGEFKQELEQYPLRFSFQDGIVEELCPTLEESSWSLNIKRGILSAFQNSMDSFDRDQNLVETDVIGKCRTDYKLAQTGWKSKTVKKSKDMISCTERHGYESSIQSSLYNVPANVRSLPLLKSTHDCDQEVSVDGHIQSVECHEMHIFRPFSKGNSGAMTEVTQKLKFLSMKAGGSTRMAEVPRRANILFEHTMGEKQETANKKAAEDKLKELCSTTEQGIQSTTPRLFSELVYLMKKLNANAMDALYKEVKKASFCPKNAEKVKKFYLDAIPMVGTGAAVGQITQLILSKDVTGKFADAWLTSITFIQHPTKDMLAELTKLLNTADASRVLLSLSTLTASYCKLNPGCDSEKEMIAVLDKLQTNLGMDCSGADKHMTLLTLRAIGNIEQSQRFVPTLENCFGNKQNPTEIRVAAVEAYRKMSCGADRNNLMALYRNGNEDSEIRVMAYLQVMKCPSENIIQQVKDTLQAEEVNQVGSFVWTHLTNLMETSSPLKQSLKAILEDHDLPKKFDLDQRKFSRNYDWSYFSESMNAGGSIESNLVWSTESFLPRSGMANLTIDMFGRSVNLLEVGGRMEGLDYLLESYFGPSGSLNDGTISPNQNDHSDLKMKKLNKIDNAFNKKVQELKGAMYIRVFGNEIIYQNLDGQSNKPNGKGFNILEMFMELKKDHDISYTKSSMFLDSSIIVPTVVGLPLNLTINGTATVDLNAKGKMDLGKPAKVILIEGEIAPSGAVEFSTVMSVDAFVTKSGMKMTSTLHTSTAFSGKVEIKEKDDITVQFNVPQQKSEILSVQSSFFTIHNDQERKQKMIANKEIKKDFCSGYTLAKITGLELCGKMSFVNASDLPSAPYFPLTGPVNLVYELEKKDTHTGYRFQLKKINNRKQVNIKVFYDTPGGKVERATGFELNVNKRYKTMLLELISPWKKARFNGNLVNNKNMKKISGIATVDDTSEYRLVADMPIEEKKNVIKYKPKLEIMYPDRDPIMIVGAMEYQKRKSLTSNVQIIGVQKSPMTLDSMIKYTDKMKGISFKFVYEKTKMYAAEVMVRTDIKKTRLLLKPKVNIRTPTKELALFLGSMDYKVGKAVKIDMTLSKVVKNDIKLKANLVWDKKGLRARYKGRANFKGPKCSMRMRLNIDKRAKMIQSTLRADYNFARYIKNAKDSFLFTSKVINKSTKTYKNVNLKTNFKSGRFADYNNQLVVNMDHRFNKLGDLDVVFDYGKNFLDKQLNKKKIALHASAKYNAKKNFESANIQYNVTMKYPAMGFQTMVYGKHYHTKKNVKSAFSVQYDNKKQLDFGIKFSDETKKFPKYTGELAMNFNKRSIEVEALAVKKAGEYSTKWKVSHQKGKASVILGSIKFPSNTSMEAKSNVQIFGQEPISLIASGDIDMKAPQFKVDITSGQDKYKAMAGVEYTENKYGHIMSEITYPARSVSVDLEGGIKNGKYVGKVDVAWNATQDPDQRVLFEVSSRYADIKDFEGYFITKLPGRKVSLTVRHNMKNSVDSLIEVTWSPKDKISAMVQYSDDRRKFKGDTSATVGFTSPFKNFEEYRMTVSHSYNKKSYESMLSITYGKMKTVSLTAITNIPVTIDNFDFKLLMKTPYPRIRNPVLEVSQRLGSNNIKHDATVSLTWGNKQFINLETNGVTQPYRRDRREMTRNIGFTSSFLNYESVVINITHYDNLEKFESRATINHNNVIYKYKVDMTHSFTNWQVDHSGTFTINSPYDNMSMLWNIRNSDRDVRSNVEVQWGNGQKFTATLDGDITESPNRRYKSKFEMNIPSNNAVRRVDASFDHEDRAGFIKTEAFITADRKNIGNVKIDYLRQLGSADFDLGITSIYMNDFKVKLNGKHAIMPMTGLIKVEWAPRQEIVVDASYSLIDRNLNSMLTLRTPFHPVRNVVFTANHLLKGFSWDAQTSIEYAPNQKVTLGSTYRLDALEKAVKVFITTPFPQFQNMQTGFRLSGDKNKFDSSADFKAIPWVRQITATASWKAGRRSIGRIGLTTPFKQYPGLKGELSTTVNTVGRTSTVWLEYLPTQKIEVEGTYSLTKTDIDGTFVIKTPFGHPVNIGYRQNGDVNAFSNHAEIRYNFNQSIVIDTTFGLQPQIYGTYSMISPIKGYEEVKFAFSHEGKKWNDFRTTVEYGTDGNKVEMEGMLKLTDKYQGKMMLRSPFRDLKLAQIAFSHEGNSFNFKSRGEVSFNDESLIGDGSFSHAMQSTVGSFTLNTPFQPAKFMQVAFNNQGTLSNFRSHGETTFNSRKYETDVIFTHSDKITSGSITGKTPVQGWEETVLEFNRDGTADNFKASGMIRYTDKKIEGSLTHEFKKDDVNTVATLSSPFTDNVVFKLNQNTRPKGFVTDTEFSVGNENSWKSHTFYKLRRGNLRFESDVEVVMTGEKNILNLEAEHKGDITDFTSKASGAFNAKKASVSLQYKGDKWENVNAAAKVELPVKDYEQLEFVLTNKKSGLTHKMDMDLQYATNKKISSKSSMTVNLPSVLGTLDVTTPFQGFSAIDVVLSHKETRDDYDSEMKVLVEKKPLYQVTSTFNKRTFLGEISALRKDKKVFNMKYDEKKERRQLSTALTYNGTMTISMGTGCQVDLPLIDCDLQFSTPYSRDLDIKLQNSVKLETYTSVFKGTYGSNVISASSSINTKLPLNWNIKLATPYTEDLTVTLQHSESNKEYSTEVDGQLGFSNVNAKSIIGKDLVTINTAVTFSSPSSESFAFTFTNGNNGAEYVTEAEGTYGVKTMRLKSTNAISFPSIDSSTQFTSPFTEDLDITITNDKRRKAYITTASGSYGDKVSKVTSNIEVNLPSVSAMITVANSHPHSDFGNMKISFKHDGEWQDMKTTVSLNTDKHDPILGESHFKYGGQSNVEASAKFTSGISGAENLGFSLSNSKNNGAYVAHLDITMDSSRQIVFDSSSKFLQRSNNDMESDIKVSLSTPFKKLSSAKYMATYKKQGLNTRSSEYVEYNGKDYLDYSSIVNLEPKSEFYSISYDYRAPSPMEFVVNVRPSYLEGNAKLNWNKLDANSNIQIDYKANGMHQPRFLQGSLEANVVHPKLAVKLEKNLYFVAPDLMSKLMVTVIDGQQQMIGYDLHLDRNRRYLKVVTPERSVEGEHKYTAVSDEAQVLWDADGDKNKKVAVKVTQGDAAQFDRLVELQLPDFGKQYSFHTKVNQGKTVLDATTEFSYSNDKRKNIVMMARIQDNSQGSIQNNSWTVGVSQPSTNLDISLSGHCGNDGDRQTLGLGVGYMTEKRQQKNLLLLGEIDALKKQISLNAYGPQKSMGMKGRVESEVPYKVIVSGMIDGVESDCMEATLDEQKRMAMLKVKYQKGSQDAVYLMGKYPTNRDIEAQIYHTKSSSQVTDSLLNINLKSTRILHTKLHWRPEMIADLLEYMSQTLQVYGKDVNDMFEKVGMEIANEFAKKDASMSKELVSELRPFLDSMVNQVRSLQREMKVMKQMLAEMKQNNTLYLRDINDAFDNSIQEFIVSFGKAARGVRKGYVDMSVSVAELSNKIKNYPFQKKYTEMVQKMSQKMEECRQDAMNMMRKEVAVITDKMRVKIQELKTKIMNLAEQAKNIASEKLDAIIQHPDIVQMTQQMKTLAQRIPLASDIDFNKYLNKIHTAVKSGIKNTKFNKYYNDAVTKVNSVVNKHYDDLAKDMDYQNFKKMLNEIYQEMLVQYQYLKLRDSVQGMVKGMVKDTKKFITEDIAQLKIIGWHKSRIIEFDPVNGNIEAEIYIPTAMETLERLPKIPIKKMEKLANDVKEIVESMIPDKDFCLWDFYYRYKPRSLNPIDWIPPFKAHAMIVDGRHYVTFDGKKFDFSGSCSFVLARDLVNQNFTVIVNYDRQGQNMQSLLVFAEGQNIEILPGFVIKVNQRQHELPYSLHKLNVERMGNWIRLDTGRGLVITGDAINNHYSIEVSGWYFGKMAGLLGTYNNEQYDESMGSNAKMEKNFNDFTKSWEVSKACKPRGNQAQQITIDKSQVQYQKCSTLFELNSSEFRPCFKQVDPRTYLSMCMNKNDFCAAASAYVAACNVAGVYLSRPTECVQCSAPNDEIFMGGERIKVSSSPEDYNMLSSADTVIIVEEKSCNQLVTKELGDLIYEIENSLMQKGLTSNRYGLVGYGKSGPNSHTMEGQLMNEASKFNMGVESLKFSSHFTDALEAIMHSINYPFRSGVAKNIILLQCGRCSDTKNMLFHNVKTLLKRRDIKLHILRDQEFKVGNRSPKQKILGIDSDRKYVLGNRRDTALDALLTPIDTCTSLALQSNGSIFDSSTMIAKKIRDRKYFLNVVSSRISESSKAHDCQVCKCMADETGYATSVCRKCYAEFSDYLPNWLMYMKRPSYIHQEIKDTVDDFLKADKAWPMLNLKA